MSLRVLLADDHAMLREELRSILEKEPTMEVVGEAADGRDALKLVDDLNVDVVVMDIGMPNLNGVDATRQIKVKHPKVGVVALSAHCDKRYVLAMLEAGACCYVLKNEAGDELLRAIKAASRGQK